MTILALLAVTVCAVGIGVPALGERNLKVAYSATMDIPEQVFYNDRMLRYNDDVVSILFLGLDDETNYADVRPGARCADANLLVTIDTKTGRVAVLAFPRDTDVLVDIYDTGAYVGNAEMQLCLAYSTDAASEQARALNSCKSVSRLINSIDINYYFALDQQALERITSDIGGVPVVIDEPLPHTDYEVGDTVVLQGYDAWHYCHYRDISIEGSAQDRLRRQIQFVNSFAKKAKSFSVRELIGLYNSVQSNVTSNISLTELSYLAKCFIQAPSLDLSIKQIEGTVDLRQDGDGIYREHVSLDEKALYGELLAIYYESAEQHA